MQVLNKIVAQVIMISYSYSSVICLLLGAGSGEQKVATVKSDSKSAVR